MVTEPRGQHELAFAVRGVGKVIGEHVLLDGLDFEIRRGEKVALIGPSGAGKTTLLRVLAGVLWPTRGRVFSLGLDTQDMGGRQLRELRSRLGFIYQSDNLIPGLRVAHNVAMGRLGRMSIWRAILGLAWPPRIGEVKSALQRVELADKLWSLPATLSGGEQQRVALARLLLQQPDAVLADEPVSALDVRLGREIIDLLTDQATERGATLVVSLHDLTMVDERFDRVIALRDGRQVWDRPPAWTPCRWRPAKPRAAARPIFRTRAQGRGPWVEKSWEAGRPLARS
jgi:phosphonate transport system ATP-binding protein